LESLPSSDEAEAGDSSPTRAAAREDAGAARLRARGWRQDEVEVPGRGRGRGGLSADAKEPAYVRMVRGLRQQQAGKREREMAGQKEEVLREAEAVEQAEYGQGRRRRSLSWEEWDSE